MNSVFTKFIPYISKFKPYCSKSERPFCSRTGLCLSTNGMPLVFTSPSMTETQTLVTRSVEKILKETEIPYSNIDSADTNLGFFSKVDKIAVSHDPNSKVYVCGRTVQSFLNYLYWHLLNEHQKNPGAVSSKQLLEDFLEKESTFSQQEVFGIGQNTSLLIDPRESLNNLEPIIDQVQQLILEQKTQARNDEYKKLISACIDVQNFVTQQNSLIQQSANPLDRLCFPITQRSGHDFIIPKDAPEILQEYFQGRCSYVPAQTDSQSITAITKTIALLLEQPHLTIDNTSSELFLRDIKKLSDSNSIRPDQRQTMNQILSTAVRCSRYYQGYPHPCNDIKTKKNPTHEAISKLSDCYRGTLHGTGFLPLIPDFISATDIELRSEDFDPGNLRKLDILIPSDQFIREYTDRGYIYHGTSNYLNIHSIIRNGFIISSNKQGAAIYGSGVYTSKEPKVSLAYTKNYDPLKIMCMKVRTSQKLRILNLHSSKISPTLYLQWEKEASQLKIDLNQHLSKKYHIDIIISEDGQPLVLMQNLEAIELPSSIEQMQLKFVDLLIPDLQTSFHLSPYQSHLEENISMIKKLLASLNKTISPQNKQQLERLSKKLDDLITKSKYHYNHLKDASEEAQNNKDLIVEMINKNGSALEFVQKKFQNDPTIVLAAVIKDGATLQFASDSCKTNKEIAIAAINQPNLAFQYVDDSLKDDYEITLAAVKKNGLNLQFASNRLRNNQTIIQAAIAQNTNAIQFTNNFQKTQD